MNENGLSLITEEYKHIFVHKTMFRGYYHVGQNVNVKIIHVKNDNEYNGSLIEQKKIKLILIKNYY